MISLDAEQGDNSAKPMIDRAFTLAVYAYFARWLLLGDAANTQDLQKLDKLMSSKRELADNLRREARWYMYARHGEAHIQIYSRLVSVRNDPIITQQGL